MRRALSMQLTSQSLLARGQSLCLAMGGRPGGPGMPTYQQLLPRFACGVGESRVDQLCQTCTFSRQRIPDDGLQRGVAWPHDPLADQKNHQFRQQEGGRYVCAR